MASMPKNHTHRVPLLGNGLRRFEDPEDSRDPRVSAVVTALKALPAGAVAPAPQPHFRAELRAQLVAVAPRIVAEAAAETAPAIDTARGSRPAARTAAEPARTPRTREPRSFGRPLRLAGAVLTLFLIVLGGATWASQRALPGDALYGLKRAGESVRLSLASSDTARAKLYLGFAGTRVQEARTLVERSVAESSALSAGARLSWSTADLVRRTLGSSDSDVRAATRLLTTDAVRTHSGSGLVTMRRWAPSQVGRLRRLAAMLPSGALRQRATASSKLVQQAAHRALAVDNSLDSPCVTRSGSDPLGTKPCAGTSPRPSGASHHQAHPGNGGGATHPGGPSPSSAPANGGGTRTGSSAARASGAPHGTGGSGGSGPRSSADPSLPIPLPTLPSLPLTGLPGVSLPVSVGSCGVSLPLGIALGGCPSS